MAPILHASACPQCGEGGGGDCPDGEECLPSDYIDPADCPPGDTFTPRAACINLLGFGKSAGDIASGETYDLSCLAPPDDALLVVLAAYETCDDSSQPDVVVTDDVAYTWTDLEQAHSPGGCTIGGAIVTTTAGVGDPPFVLSFAPDSDRAMNWTVAVYAVTCSDGAGEHDSLITTKGDSGDAPSVTLTLADAHSRVLGFLVSDQDGEPWPQVATTGTELTNAGPSPVVVFSITDAGDDTLAYDVTGQEWDNDLVFAVELLGAADGGACTCSPDCPTCAECACSADAYLPYCVSPNADDPDTVILALTPFAYYPMTGALGGTDVSGNGHTATSSIGTISYGVAGISSKVAEATALSAGGNIAFPPPVTDMSAPGTAWSAVMLMQVDAYDSGAGGATSLDGGFPFFSWAGASPPKMAHTIGSTGRLWAWFDSTFGPLGSIANTEDAVFGIGEPHVLVINARTLGGIGTTEFWLDGVLALAVCRLGTGVDGTTFQVGRIAGGGPFFGAINMTFSNLATWARSLTQAEIKTVTEVLIDSTIIANAWDPSA